MPYAAILNSRQSKTPVGRDAWVSATLRAVEDAVARGYTILSSTGMHSWNLITWATGHAGGRLKLIIPAPYEENVPGHLLSRTRSTEHLVDHVMHQFDLDPALTECEFLAGSRHSGSRKGAWSERDRILVAQADNCYPICLRPGSTLAELCAEKETNRIIEEFRVPYGKPAVAKRAYTFDHHHLSTWDNDWDYITHWTRTSHNPWPAETAADFYRAIIISGNDYPRSARSALGRILEERKIRGSANHMRAKRTVVCFTELPPSQAVTLMTWRRRQVRWNFEPYGIAIRRAVAEKMGCRPVIYGSKDIYDTLSSGDQPFFQNIGEQGDWRSEREWRCVGDLDLTLIPPEALRVLIYTSADTKYLPEMANIRLFELTL